MHFARNLHQTISKTQQVMVAAELRYVYAQQDRGTVEKQWDQITAMLTPKSPKAAELMASARKDVPACRHFRQQQCRKL